MKTNQTIDTKKLSNSLLDRVDQAELFSRRFGSFNKSDYEVLMFTIYLDSMVSEASDYEISIALGIPESKVRTLRVKSQLQYPRDINWVEDLAVALSHGSYEEGKITVTIEDPSVRNRIQYEVESRFGVVYFSLNRKHLVLPVESYLLLAMCAERDEDELLERLNRRIREKNITVGKIEKQSFKKRFFKSAPETLTFLNNVSDIYKKGKPIVMALIMLISG